MNSTPLDELIAIRRQKLQALRDQGIDPFGAAFETTGTVADVVAQFQEGSPISLAGRITAYRNMGKSHFLDLSDVGGRIQVYINTKELDEQGLAVATQLDIGDFLGVEGNYFTTKSGEKSIRAQRLVMLTKTLRPLPDKWHGVQDPEIRYRQRYLDLIANAPSRTLFLQRIAIVRELRRFLEERGFLEVETPMMQAIAGGAAAEPFRTHHNALGMDLFLRIAPELYLKRLLVAGFPKVFELNRNFRNEGVSRRHNPEFTMLEAYWAFADFKKMSLLVEEMICHLARMFHPSRSEEAAKADETRQTRILMQGCMDTYCPNQNLSLTQYSSAFSASAVERDKISGLSSHLGVGPLIEHCNEEGEVIRTINLARPWRRESYRNLVNAAVPGWFELNLEAKRKRCAELQLDITHCHEEFEITQHVFEKLVEEKLIDPCFVTQVPKELVPLAKLNAQDPATVDVYELIINGQEISPGYSELNDPDLQRERLEHQAGEEKQSLDEDFLESLEYGMPPAGGIGIGIDRLVMMLTGAPSIRDVILFPHLKRKS